MGLIMFFLPQLLSDFGFHLSFKRWSI